jgi:hypothetical protein
MEAGRLNPDQNGTDYGAARQRREAAAPRQCSQRTEARQARAEPRPQAHRTVRPGLARTVLYRNKRRQTGCAMKWLIAIIKPFTLEDVRQALPTPASAA